LSKNPPQGRGFLRLKHLIKYLHYFLSYAIIVHSILKSREIEMFMLYTIGAGGGVYIGFYNLLGGGSIRSTSLFFALALMNTLFALENIAKRS